MARRRYQDPHPIKSGNFWYLFTWVDVFENGVRKRKRKREKLAPGTMPEREVRKIAAEKLRVTNQGLVTAGSAVTFQHFVENVYQPVVLATMSKTTQDRSRSILKNYLVPHFGTLALRDITMLTVDRYFASLGTLDLSHESIDKVRDILSGCLKAAIRYELLIKNPVQGVRLPKARRTKRNKPYLTPEQFHELLAVMTEPYASMVYVAVYTGLRISELLALRWKNVHTDSITIEERYSRGDFSVPKSQASSATIAVSKSVIDRILHLKDVVVHVKAGRATRRYPAVKSDGPEELVFQAPRTGGVMQDNNLLCRHLKPAAQKAGVPFVNWQVLRRSFATWLAQAGTDVRTAQSLLRHSRASTTLDVYQQFVPESQRRAVERLDVLY